MDRFRGNITGNFRGNPLCTRQRDQAQRELGEHDKSGSAGCYSQFRQSGTCRPDPDDVSLTFSDSLHGPGDLVAQAVRGSVKAGPSKGGSLDDTAAVGSKRDPNVSGGIDTRPSEVDIKVTRARGHPKRPPPSCGGGGTGYASDTYGPPV